jgi:dedicated sortase system histidine kinase
MRVALGIRAQLLLVLTVFLALPWLGYEYVRELERFLRDAQERALASTAQAVSIALNDRPRLFAGPADPIASFAQERADEEPRDGLPPSASPEIARIVQGLSRTTARVWVIDREGVVLARSGSLKQPLPEEPPASWWRRVSRATLGRLYAMVLTQPSEDFADDAAARGPAQGKDVEGALTGILTTLRRPTSDGRAVIVSAAHPVWVGDQVRGAVVVEETTNRVVAERNRAFERLFDIVLAVLLVGTLALTWFASRLATRIRRLRDDAERAIDPQGRVVGRLARSDAGDEVGDLSRSFSAVLERLSEYAGYQEQMAARLSHELRTPVAVVRSSLDNLDAQPLPAAARVYIGRAQGGIARLAAILARMSEAARLEQSLSDVERERFDLAGVVAGCVDGYRQAYPRATFDLALPPEPLAIDGAPDLVAQMLDKLVANAVEFSTGGAIELRLAREGDEAILVVANEGPSLPAAMEGRLLDSMVSVRPESRTRGMAGPAGGSVQPAAGGADAASPTAAVAADADLAPSTPHLGLGLYIARLVAEFHRGRIDVRNRDDGRGVVVRVALPTA